MSSGLFERCRRTVCWLSGNRMLLVLRVDIVRFMMGYEEGKGPVLTMPLQIRMRASSRLLLLDGGPSPWLLLT